MVGRVVDSCFLVFLVVFPWFVFDAFMVGCAFISKIVKPAGSLMLLGHDHHLYKKVSEVHWCLP